MLRQVIRTDWKNGRSWAEYEDLGPGRAESRPAYQLESGRVRKPSTQAHHLQHMGTSKGGKSLLSGRPT